jgi:hypothetical protein
MRLRFLRMFYAVYSWSWLVRALLKVRFSPDSDRMADIPAGPGWGHKPKYAVQQHRYSIRLVGRPMREGGKVASANNV